MIKEIKNHKKHDIHEAWANGETIVRFYIHPEDEEILAYFPFEKWDSAGNFTSYAHVGQHGACSPDYIKECDIAPKETYSPLLRELEGIYKNLTVLV